MISARPALGDLFGPLSEVAREIAGQLVACVQCSRCINAHVLYARCTVLRLSGQATAWTTDEHNACAK